MSSFLEGIDFDNIEAPSAVPGDSEYKLRIVDVKTDLSTANGLPLDKNGNSYLLPRFEIVGEPTAKEFTRYMAIPSTNMDDKKRNSAGYLLKQFLAAFSLNVSAVADPQDLIGAEGWAILGMENNDQYGEQNFIKKFIAPR